MKRKCSDHSQSLLICIYIPEIINFVLAALCLTVILPTVFSTTSMLFAVIFSVMIFVSTTNTIVHCISNQLIISQKIKTELETAVAPPSHWRLHLSGASAQINNKK